MRGKDIMMWNAKENRRADESVSSMMRQINMRCVTGD